MKSMGSIKKKSDLRKFKRIDAAFMAQFRLISSINGQYLSDWLVGRIENVAKGGLRLSLALLDVYYISQLQEKKVHLLIEIFMPIIKKPVSVIAYPCWVKKTIDGYQVGLEYQEIKKRQRKLVWMAQIRHKLYFAFLFIVVIVLTQMLLAIRFIQE